MRKLPFFSIFLLLCTFAWSIWRYYGPEHSDILPEKEPVKVPPSFISFNINFPIHALENGVNRILNTTLINDALPMNDKGDTLYLKVIKKGTLHLSLANNEIHANVPLAVEVAVKKKIMGISFSNQDRPIRFAGKVSTTATASLDSLWNFELSCESMDLKWDRKPSIQIFGMEIDLSKTVNKALDDNKQMILYQLCNAINQSINFQKTLEKIWGDLQQPIRIARNPQELWLYTNPESISAELQPLVDDTLSLHLEYKASLHLTSDGSRKKKIVPLPNGQTPLHKESAILAYLEGKLPLKFLNSVMDEALIGQHFEYQGYALNILDIRLSHNGNMLIVSVDVGGDINATITIEGEPALTEDQQFTLNNFKYKINSQDGLTSAADWITHAFLEAYLANVLFVDASKFLNNVDSLANHGIAKAPVGSKIATDLAFTNIQSYQMVLYQDTLQWVFYVEGTAGLNLKENIFQ